jgi:hypothetical protein
MDFFEKAPRIACRLVASPSHCEKIDRFFENSFFPTRKLFFLRGLLVVLTRFRLIITFLSGWIVAIVLPSVSFAPGNWNLGHFERIHEHVSPGMRVLLEIIGICLITGMATLGILIAVSVWRRRRKKQEDDYAIYRENPHVTLSVYTVIILLLVGLGSLIWLSWQHSDVFLLFVKKFAPL